MKNASLELFADPLGDLYVEWAIPVELISESSIKISLPTFKYEMSFFMGNPVPFASIAEKTETEVYKVEIANHYNEVKHEVKNEFKGGLFLMISLTKEQLDLKSEILRVQYVIRRIVNKDRIYFNFVYTFTSPLKLEIFVDISVKVKFSYHISSYKFKAVQIDEITGRIINDTGLFHHNRIGDYIHGYGENIKLTPNGLLDLHVHGSRLPIMIDRRIFWILIFTCIIIGLGGFIGIIKLFIDNI